MEFKKLLDDPEKHDPNNFVYMVHALLNRDNPFRDGRSEDSKGRLGELFIESKLKRIQDPNEYFRASLISRMGKDDAIKRVYYHGDIDQLANFGGIGFIINPSHNGLVKIAWNCDLGSPENGEKLRDYVNEHRGKIRAPLYLLTQTVDDPIVNYNELVLSGDKATQIQGVFYDENYGKKGKANIEALLRIANKWTGRELPIIILPERKKTYDYENIKKNPEERALAVQCQHLKVNASFLQYQYEFHHWRELRAREIGFDKIEKTDPSKYYDFKKYFKQG